MRLPGRVSLLLGCDSLYTLKKLFQLNMHVKLNFALSHAPLVLCEPVPQIIFFLKPVMFTYTSVMGILTAFK